MSGLTVYKGIFENAGDIAGKAAQGKSYGADGLWLFGRAVAPIDIIVSVRSLAGCDLPIFAAGQFPSLDDAIDAAEAGAQKLGVYAEAIETTDIVRRVAYKYDSARVAAVLEIAEREGGFTLLGADGEPAAYEWLDVAKHAQAQGAGEILLLFQGDVSIQERTEAIRLLADAVKLPIVATVDAKDVVASCEGLAQTGVSGLLDVGDGEETLAAIQDWLAAQGGRAKDEDAIHNLAYDVNGLIPAIAQDVNTGAVLMLAYMNEESLRRTLETGFATYYSRSRQKLWQKGETSGHVQRVQEMLYDCDGDALLLKVDQTGPACHTGNYSCFANPIKKLDIGRASMGGSAVLERLYGVIRERRAHPVEGSYTNKLQKGGVDRIGKKVIEEAAELVIAAKNAKEGEVAFEAADLLYHLLVLLEDAGVAPNSVFAELANRE
jgi:phosphoribosyl-ATP pyrophosphohydrolase/phosphoribosyl-AMP cyclohydrolase